MARTNVINVKMLVMHRHFLYLPLYVAEHEDWFGKLPKGYSLEIRPPVRDDDHTDKGVFDLLMTPPPWEGNVMFAACDPTVVLDRWNENARMAATLVASSAFWAVNHKAKDVRLISDLASFDKILCYGAGTTSNLIAKRIVKHDVSKLQIVNDASEIAELRRLGEGALALSPEVLSITNLIHGPLRNGEKKPEVVFELSNSKEFSNVLTTVLFTRSDIVEQHSALVSGVLMALQLALFAIHSEDPIVEAAANFSFRDAFSLKEALKMAADGNVFPDSIHIKRDRWQRASEFYFISRALAEGEEKNELSDEEQRKAENVYETTVLDAALKKIVSDSFLEVIGGQNRKCDRRAGLKCSAFTLAGFVLGAAIVYLATNYDKGTSSAFISSVALVTVEICIIEWLRFKKWVLVSGFLLSFALLWLLAHHILGSRLVPEMNVPFLAHLGGDAMSYLGGLSIAVFCAVVTAAWNDR